MLEFDPSICVTNDQSTLLCDRACCEEEQRSAPTTSVQTTSPTKAPTGDESTLFRPITTASPEPALPTSTTAPAIGKSQSDGGDSNTIGIVPILVIALVLLVLVFVAAGVNNRRLRAREAVKQGGAGGSAAVSSDVIAINNVAFAQRYDIAGNGGRDDRESDVDSLGAPIYNSANPAGASGPHYTQQPVYAVASTRGRCQTAWSKPPEGDQPKYATANSGRGHYDLLAGAGGSVGLVGGVHTGPQDLKTPDGALTGSGYYDVLNRNMGSAGYQSGGTYDKVNMYDVTTRGKPNAAEPDYAEVGNCSGAASEATYAEPGLADPAGQPTYALLPTIDAAKLAEHTYEYGGVDYASQPVVFDGAGASAMYYDQAASSPSPAHASASTSAAGTVDCSPRPVVFDGAGAMYYDQAASSQGVVYASASPASTANADWYAVDERTTDGC